MELLTTVIFSFLLSAALAEYPASGPYPSGKYPPAGAPDPGPGTGPAPTGPSGPGPSGPGPSGPAPSGPGPAPFGPGPVPFGPGGPGPWGPFGPFGGPWGPSGPGPFPPALFPPPPVPFGRPGSLCAVLERFRVRALRATRPLLAGGVGAALLWALKSLIIPNIAIVTTAFKRRMGIEEDTALDRMATDVSRAVSNGLCMEKVACVLGKSATKNYPTARHLVRVIEPKSMGAMENFVSAFQRYATQDQDCDALMCS